MKRRFRLTRSADFQRVRRIGKSFPHPLIVLVAAPNDSQITRIAVVASRALGIAVRRNRAKRWIRASLQELISSVEPGWDLIIIARRPLSDSSFKKTQEALINVLNRANLLKSPHESTPTT